MPAQPNAPLREEMPKPPVQVEHTGPLTHAQILRECAPLCRNAGPGQMGTATPGKVRSARNSQYIGE
jgi:hypothetical protein